MVLCILLHLVSAFLEGLAACGRDPQKIGFIKMKGNENHQQSVCLRPTGLNVLFWGYAIHFFKHLDEVADIRKPACRTCLRYRGSAAKQPAGMRDAHGVEIMNIGCAGQGFKTAAKIVFAVSEPFCYGA